MDYVDRSERALGMWTIEQIGHERYRVAFEIDDRKFHFADLSGTYSEMYGLLLYYNRSGIIPSAAKLYLASLEASVA